MQHEGGAFEVACNLLHSKERGWEQVLERARKRALEVEVEVEHFYCTGPSEDELLAQI